MVFRAKHLRLHRTFVGTNILDYTELTFPSFLDRYRPNRSVEMIPLKRWKYETKGCISQNFPLRGLFNDEHRYKSNENH